MINSNLNGYLNEMSSITGVSESNETRDTVTIDDDDNSFIETKNDDVSEFEPDDKDQIDSDSDSDNNLRIGSVVDETHR